MFWLKLKLCFHQRKEAKKKREKEKLSRASLICFANTSQCQYQSILLLGTSFDHHGLKKNWSFFFLPYSCSWQSMVILKKKKAAKRTLRQFQWYCSPPAICEALKDLVDEWVYKKQKKQNLIIMFRNLD